MKLAARFLFLLLLTLTVFTVQEVRAQAPRRISAAERRSAEAAWPQFFRRFSAAVRTRDRAALRAMMHQDFSYYGGEAGVSAQSSNDADRIFADMSRARGWGRRRDHGWIDLQTAARRGVIRENGDYPTRLITTGPHDNYDEYGSPKATFEFRNGRWYWNGFGKGQ